MTVYTGGQWHVRKTYSGRSSVPTYWIAPEGPEPGTPALAKILRGNRNRIEHAHLMAAAPELLAVLDEFMEMDIPCPYRGNDGRLREWCEWYKKAKETIAKAVGGKP